MAYDTYLSHMSDYRYTEKPFLTQLQALGWAVTDQGAGIPARPTRP